MIPLCDRNPTKHFSVITFCLIIVNITVFTHELAIGDKASNLFVQSFAFGGTMPGAVTIFTSMFIHGSFLHIAGNMLFLWIFGKNIEDAIGRVWFIIFYLLCGVVAAYAHAYMNPLTPLIGASGAISGMLGAYLFLYPRARVRTLMFFGFYARTIVVPAIAVLGFWFLLQFLNALQSRDLIGGVAWYAHVGGFIAGILLIGIFKLKAVLFGRRITDINRDPAGPQLS